MSILFVLLLLPSFLFVITAFSMFNSSSIFLNAVNIFLYPLNNDLNEDEPIISTNPYADIDIVGYFLSFFIGL